MHKKLIIFIIGLCCTILFIVLTENRIFNRYATLVKINYIFYDTNLALFHRKERSDAIVIIDIDDRSLQLEGHWPWPRTKIAAMIKKLLDQEVAVITFDILFPEKERNIAQTLLSHAESNRGISQAIKTYLAQQMVHFDSDRKLAEIIGKGDIVLGEFFSSSLPSSTGQLGKFLDNAPPNLTILHASNYIGNIDVLTQAARHSGFTTTLPDQDGIIRRSPLLIEHSGKLYPSLSLTTLQTYLMSNHVSLDLHEREEKKIFLGIALDNGMYIPTDLAGNIMINYRGPAFSFPYLAATDLLSNKFSRKLLEGKIVIIGSSAIGIGDLHSTPLEAVTYPGTEIHANIIASILDNKMIASPIWMTGVERIMLAVIGITITLLAAFLPALTFILLSLICIIIIAMLHALLLIKSGLIFPHPVIPYMQIFFLAVINSGCGYLFETRNRKKLHNIYGQYVSSTYIDKMLHSQDKHTLEGNTKSMTVFFTDVQGFTSISEKLDAKDVKRFLNTLFTPLTEIIFSHKGTIDKYVGDLIMAFWNDPIEDPDHATHCVEAALKMQTKVAELAPVFAMQDLHGIAIRTGINTGPMHVGDMGSQYRKAYTVLGDAVNLASRLEGVNKLYGTKILVSAATKDACQNIVFRFIDRIYVKGKDRATEIYEPLSLASEIAPVLQRELDQYQAALDLYEHRNWQSAKEKLSTLVTAYPQTELYKIYLARATKYCLEPPPLDYDFTQHLTTK